MDLWPDSLWSFTRNRTKRLSRNLKQKLMGVFPLLTTFVMLGGIVFYISEQIPAENSIRQATLISSVALTGVLAHLYLRMSNIQNSQREILSNQTDLQEAEHTPIVVVEEFDIFGNDTHLTLSNVGKGIASKIAYQAVYTPAKIEDGNAVPTAGYSKEFFRPPAMFPLERTFSDLAGGKNYLLAGERGIDFGNSLMLTSPNNPVVVGSFEMILDSLQDRGISNIILQIQINYSYQEPIEKRRINALPPIVVDLDQEGNLEDKVLEDVTAITANHFDTTPFIPRGNWSREEVIDDVGPQGYMEMVSQEGQTEGG